MEVTCDETNISALLISVQGFVVHLEDAKYSSKNWLPYLMQAQPKKDELWLIGRGNQSLVLNSVFGSALLKTVAGAGMGSCDPSNCILIPDAPLEVLQHFCQLLHTGRLLIFLCTILYTRSKYCSTLLTGNHSLNISIQHGRQPQHS